MVTITVGQQIKKEFQMHRGLLVFHSKYYKNLFDGPFKEGQSATHEEPDVAANTFQMFYSWMYIGTITDANGCSDSKINHIDMVLLYAFADFHMIDSLMYRILELFLVRVAEIWGYPMHCSSLLYDSTTEKSPLRQLHVDILLEIYALGGGRDELDKLPADMLMDIIETCKRKEIIPGKPKLPPRKDWIEGKRKTFCELYHQHTEVATPSSAQ